MDEESQVAAGTAYDQAKETLVSHRDQLELVAAELLRSETIDGPTFTGLFVRRCPHSKIPDSWLRRPARAIKRRADGGLGR
jgi:ATP-dependent Zn protease